MGNLTEQNKFNILQTFILLAEKEHPEFQENNTTGWDLMENAKLWLEELQPKKVEAEKEVVAETEKEKA
jgi:hypothetical protein